MKGVGLLAAACLSLGCAAGGRAGGTPAPEVAADPGEYARFLAGGDASIEGTAFVRTRNGGLHYADIFPVFLDPVTSFSRGWQRRGASTDQLDPPPPDRLFRLARQAAVPVEQGKFTFMGLAPGWYYIETLVAWDNGELAVESYVLRDSVEARPGRTVSVVLTRVR